MKKTQVIATILMAMLFLLSAGIATAGETAPKTEKKKTPWKPVKGHAFKMIHEENFSNCIFSTKALSFGKEASYAVKDKFTKPEPVYARCYFPGPVGEVEGEDFWHEIWIDGNFAMKTSFVDPPDPDWDTIQVIVTEKDYTKQMEELEPGEHEVYIWVMKNVFKGQRAVAEETASGEIKAEMKDIWVPDYLSTGKFLYIVPKEK